MLCKKLKIAIVNSTLEKKYHSYGDHWVDGFQDAGCEVTVFSNKKFNMLPLNFDLYFFVEIRCDPRRIPWHISPRVMYSWDAHILGHMYYRTFTNNFDRIFLASRIDAEKLNSEGYKNVSWLPEACNPRIHKDYDKHRKFDLGFIGKGNADRIRNGRSKNDFIQWIKSSKFKTFFDHDKWGEEYVEMMNTAKIVFDRPISHNVGTRVFESAAMGCVPLWSDTGITETCGMAKLMVPWKHYVPYNDTIEGLEKAVESLLINDSKREKIRLNAKYHVLKDHTYAHRAQTIIKKMLPDTLKIESKSDKQIFTVKDI